MNDRIFTIDKIKSPVKPIAEKYQVQKIYLFGFYARGEGFELTMTFALAEELRGV